MKFLTGLRNVQVRCHSNHVPGRVGGGIRLRNDLELREPTKQELQKGDHRSGVVLSKRVPEEFIQNTLLPHLEERMRVSIHVYTPTQLSQVARSYAKYTMDREDRGAGPLVEKLSETIKYRMPGFEAVDIIDVLPALLQIRPEDDELFSMIADRIRVKIDDFNALNLVGVVRVYLKRGDVNVVKDILLPRLMESLKTYDTVEVAEMLTAIGQATSTDLSLSGDVHILQCLIPELETRFDELPFVIQLNVVWALAKMSVNHALFREALVTRFIEGKASRDLPTKIFAKAVWVMGRIGVLKEQPEIIVSAIVPVVRDSRGLFTAPEFARLVMALAEVGELRDDLIAIGTRLTESFTSLEELDREAGSSTRKTRQDVIMLLSGLERLGLVRSGNDKLTKPLVDFIQKEENKFEPTEVQSIVGIFHGQPHEAAVLDNFPKTWKELIDSSKKRIMQIQEHM
jgi:hypothetical protein